MQHSQEFAEQLSRRVPILRWIYLVCVCQNDKNAFKKNHKISIHKMSTYTLHIKYMFVVVKFDALAQASDFLIDKMFSSAGCRNLFVTVLLHSDLNSAGELSISRKYVSTCSLTWVTHVVKPKWCNLMSSMFCKRVYRHSLHANTHTRTHRHRQ